MGRKSKLTEEQWAELFRRVGEGESRRALGEEFGLSEASIRQREAKIGKTAEVQQVARMIVETQAAYESLPRTGQINAQNLAERLKAIGMSVATGAHFSAMNFHRLSALANSELQKVDDADIGQSEGALKVVAVLTKMANEAATTPIALMNASRQGGLAQIEAPEPGAAPTSGVLAVPGLMPDAESWSAATRAAARPAE